MLKNNVIPDFGILAQPDETTCGPTCLQSVYSFFNDDISLDQVIKETVQHAEGGGTLAVILGNHALKRGYKATLYTYNLMVFDPTWFKYDPPKMIEMLERQMEVKKSPLLHFASRAYIDFLKNGGRIEFKELNKQLLVDHLNQQLPILSGLSATYLYNTPREIPETNAYDDVAGKPSGHFVVISGYDDSTDEFIIADPLSPNPYAKNKQIYSVSSDRLISAIMLGIVTFDANILILSPK